MSIEELKDFHLVGGTALSLQYGHRLSIDLAELLNHFSLYEIINFHQAKYPNQQMLLSIPQVITYFDDANESEDPVSLKGQTWDSIKQIIGEQVNKFLA